MPANVNSVTSYDLPEPGCPIDITAELFPESAATLVQKGLLADLKRMPLIIRLVLFFMVVIFCWNQPLLGVNASGLAWVISLAVSLLVLSRNMSRVTFPYFIWLPWVLLLFTYLAMVDSSLLDLRVIPLQRTFQLLSPLAVGMAVSTWRPTAVDLQAFLETCRRMAYLLLLIVLFKTGVLLTGVLPMTTGLASEAITVTLLCTLLAASHLITGSKKDLILWALMACIPIVAVTRTAIVASLLTLPLTFAPLPLMRRIVALVLIALAGVAVFNTERVQKKMFFSGKGTLGDINNSNDDFATSGRKSMWEKLRSAAEDEPWTGHGTGAGETFTYKITGKTGYPHNDWLLTMYDYGQFGVITFSLCCLLMVGDVLSKLRRRPEGATRVLLLTGAAAYIPFAIMMSTDNVMVYVSYFGNLQYSILGLAYGALLARSQENNLQSVRSNRLLSPQ